MRKVKYRCKGCGWTKELVADWADVKPRFCPTPTCDMSVKKSKGRKSFRSDPDMLETSFIEPPTHVRQEVTVSSVEYDAPKEKEESHGQRRSKAKGASEA